MKRDAAMKRGELGCETRVVLVIGTTRPFGLLHVQIFNSDLRSYRDLPLRYGEFGFCHRNEASGALHGLMPSLQSKS